ncbi:arginyl-tRNA synthetase [Paucidesulfovibrio gracilis DSM 16080]|uniref:Arginine--tRNA ligase n=1 Tax=Paucidesulfovibrio gracilis DSM 16080 TaxID=1121449 RepID=A0A1T4X804_9BACT|nr:arginine--tRNA ligase [Paucidesulfovibrio gracilis]SKA85716.1 arginyl-tRNA synthetase [Paucidesulfovibrio gracilis DSM 16080]
MRAKQHLETLLKGIVEDKGWSWPEKAVIEPPKERKFGDLAANVAMMLAREAKMAPRQIAEQIAAELESRQDPAIRNVEIAGPGFLNIFFTPQFWRQTLEDILEQGERYGESDMGHGKRVQVEFVSANPTGPLHIGHGRGAALGDSLCRILKKSGHDVEAEYYVNDAGRQMRILGESIHYRVLQALERCPEEPEDYYRGDYVRDIAAGVLAQHPELPDLDERQAVDLCREYGMTAILAGIKEDLRQFGVHHDVWFSEASLVNDGKVDETFANLEQRGMAYTEDGAFWFKSTDLGDDKDRVLRKSNGDTTYFASDIAYHDNKYQRGFDLVVDIWGADHHGYIPRMQAAVEALGRKGDLEVILVQLVNLLQGGEQVAMSTRAGKFETLKDVVDEVGADAARYIFLSRKSDSKLDFDLELVKQKTMDNPVYYVQYAHARIHSVRRKAEELNMGPAPIKEHFLTHLNTEEDMDLLRIMERYPDAVQAAAETLSPHVISNFLQELASTLHKYYTMHHVVSAEPEPCRARLLLMHCVASVLANGLHLLGVNAPERM